ncbi:MAG: uroporphyrinogen-III C-methyltransferase [Sphingomonas sp.]|nr:uroporphyrinogen-III C-methyltransferase [Sphingomonas sp.]
MHRDAFEPGTVWLVGAGPGDPDLLTRKAERLLGQADIVFHDALVGKAVLALAPHADMVSVGKRSGRHSKSQDDINDLMLGVPVRICPGVTTASAAAASGLASLTLRGLARKLTFVTAHARAGETLDLDWTALAQPDATLAIYMGRSAAPDIMRGLITAGRAPDTPVMIATNVSLPNESVLRGRLDALGFLVRAISEDAPTLILVGEAVAAHGLKSRQAQRVRSC